MTRKIRIGICGLGGFGIVCARAFKMSKKATVVAVCRRNEDEVIKYGTELNAKWYTEYQDMLEEEELDAVCITTPHHLHAEQSIAAMKKGLHVFCTKPMAITLEEADDVIRCAKKNNVTLELGYHYRHDKRIIKMKNLIDIGKIGKPFSTVTSIQTNREPEYWASSPWRSKLSESGGGALTLNYSHDIDYLQWFFGPVEWVFGKVDNVVQKVEVEDIATAVIKFTNGVMSTFTCSTAAMSSKAPRLEVFGTNGVISLVTKASKDPQYPYPTTLVALHTEGKWRTIPIRESLKIVREWDGKIMPWSVPLRGLSSIESLVTHLDKFLTCILENKEPTVPGSEGRRVIETIQAIYKSSREGRVVKLPLK